MVRLIDADALISDLKYDVELNARLLEDTNTVGFYRELCWTDKAHKENTIQFLKDAPTVDAASIKHGKWIPCMKDSRGCADMFQCSECKRYSYYAYGVKCLDYEYCPYCGAKMDIEREEE